MKALNFVIFFSVFFAIYGLSNYYIYIRGAQSIPAGSPLKGWYVIIFLVVSLSFIVGRVLERFTLSFVSELFVWIGSIWLAAMLYFFLAIILFDFLRLMNFIFHIFPSWITDDYGRTKTITALVTISAVAVLLAAAFINALTIRLRTLEISIPKKVEEMKSMNIVAVSDIHLGTIIGRKRFDRIVDKINALQPDIVLFPGDIVDEDLAPVIKENLGESLKNIKPKYGVYAITGNHEYIGGVEEACRYLIAHGVTMLRDSVVKINRNLFLIGREDRSIGQFQGKRRKSLEDLMEEVDLTYPVILMDHQPFHLEEAVRNRVDLQLSGHTHHGQLWPLNYITDKVYEISWGYEKREQTHIYVSSGAGSWGPPMRLGNTPEIVNIHLHFE
ncbi:MAG: metallophosphoesterase [Bacteroidota bacterium]